MLFTKWILSRTKYVNSLWPGECWRHMLSEILVDIGSGNGLVPDSTKPFPELMLTNSQWGLVLFTSGQFQDIYPWYEFENCQFNLIAIFP